MWCARHFWTLNAASAHLRERELGLAALVVLLVQRSGALRVPKAPGEREDVAVVRGVPPSPATQMHAWKARESV